MFLKSCLIEHVRLVIELSILLIKAAWLNVRNFTNLSTLSYSYTRNSNIYKPYSITGLRDTSPSRRLMKFIDQREVKFSTLLLRVRLQLWRCRMWRLGSAIWNSTLFFIREIRYRYYISTNIYQTLTLRYNFF